MAGTNTLKNQQLLCEAGRSVRAMPVNLNPADAGLFEHEREKEIPGACLHRLDNVTVHPRGLLFSGLHILPESFPHPRRVGLKTRMKRLLETGMPSQRRMFDDKVLWITDAWSRGYFHWIADSLPRLYMAREQAADAVLLLPGDLAGDGFVSASLKPFGLQRVEFADRPCRCRRFLVPVHSVPTGNYHEEAVKGLQTLYANYYRDQPGSGAGPRVYLSRSKAGKRKVENEEECTAVLESLGFQTVYFEDCSFDQQVKIMMEAEHLVSNHGAGLVNMLFMQPGRRVLELRKTGDSHNNCYFSLASALDLNYFYQLCDPVNPGEDAHTADLVVDCTLLRENVEQMLSAGG